MDGLLAIYVDDLNLYMMLSNTRQCYLTRSIARSLSCTYNICLYLFVYLVVWFPERVSFFTQTNPNCAV